MGVKTVEVQIGKRSYPIEVENEDEETKVKISAQMINENIKKLKGNYVVTDYVDLLAMTALELANSSENSEKLENAAVNKLMQNELEELSDKLDQALDA
ncbi:cell division protein ZapA [Salibacteraceae bacterium]|jgi:cell division protein ZapA (FtsZ GTPase activity inhibitor)|nr:cell division protein ZapA [Crocinitomicaceae bacterium]MCH9821738.1 cell division protein ZapA [Bacteroidota bacterium]MDC1204865.1 cell division protein ZapA [Salibacteraceae bacterium]|tara:strand:- start:86115 stop:86411 length:297 start_codon:yes stop_codon:yes gene_type:complete